ncbi:MAG: hypothetical protein WC076_01790 [Terrimicrobiaceae bacterium]|nr:hypothetical protein [Terrimicrobiaceae bacterium]
MPEPARDLADKCFQILKADPRHSSIRLKKVGSVWSARVGLHYRALGEDHPDGILWYWIGSRDAYDRKI